jgi:GDP-L-fucose synthase
MLPKKFYVAGHTGLVGSALTRIIKKEAQSLLVTQTHSELDLRDRAAVNNFFAREKPDCVVLAAAKVGGILANMNHPVEFLLDNLSIQSNVINACYAHGVNRLLIFGSNCAYPPSAPQPIVESALLTGPLERTNSAFATAKLAGIELCRAYNHQFGTNYLVVMPTGLYGPGDNYDESNSHVTAAMIRRFHEAKIGNLAGIRIWGSGKPLRELLYSEDCARATIQLACLDQEKFKELIGRSYYPLINIGGGQEVSILELAKRVAEIVGYTETIETDPSKPDGAPRKLLDGTRMKEFGWHPKIPLDQGLGLAYADYLARQITH